jgi:hypothetical protein
MEFIEIAGGQADGESNLKTFAEVEALEGFLTGEAEALVDEVRDDAAEVGLSAAMEVQSRMSRAASCSARASRLASARTHWAKSFEKPSEVAVRV